MSTSLTIEVRVALKLHEFTDIELESLLSAIHSEQERRSRGERPRDQRIWAVPDGAVIVSAGLCTTKKT